MGSYKLNNILYNLFSGSFALSLTVSDEDLQSLEWFE